MIIRSGKKYNPINSNILSEYKSFRSGNHRHLCNAPFKSLRFSQSGNVLACCFNRGYSLGKYPENNLHDIWFGDKISNLRKHIDHNDLTLGCNECLRRIQNKYFALSGAYQYDYLSDYPKSKYPSMLDFEISNTCNLECVMCLGENSSSIRLNRDHLPACQQHYDENFVEQLKEFIPYLSEARFSGGEPFLIPLYYDIWERISAINPKTKISILTNATILNDKIISLLSKGNFNVSVSFDSFNKDTYEKIRKNADFNTALKNLEYFQTYSKNKNTGFNLNVCPMRYNWAEIPSIVRYCNEKEISLILHTVTFPPLESIWALDSKKLKEILNTLEKEDFDSINSVSNKNLSAYHQFIHQIKKWINESESFEQRKKDLDGKTENELIELFEQYIFKGTGESSSEIISLLNKSDLSVDERKNIFINLLRFSPDLIISEFMHNEAEKLLIRLKMFNYNTL